ncbi:hypothetical protein SFA35_01620 [Pseudomonas sp. HR96]|uniref:hypothetical protein n=1 Tax=Pseudomonas sp. HR96 TaxID=1027966 RepID=UPI002A7498F6|nr:hypothetical protein [Pseudomonas sp. HR96]WPP00114.1 hypothetical protein SFA35_01620 [Pseudomonas sp. HR96]
MNNPDREEAELKKLWAEAHKLNAERHKIYAERRKLVRDFNLYPYGIGAVWVASITAVIRMLMDFL